MKNKDRAFLHCRWDMAAAEKLTKYMKTCFKALFDIVEGQGHKVMTKKGLDIIPHLRRAVTS